MKAIKILSITVIAILSFITVYGYCDDATTAKGAELTAGNSVNTLPGYSVQSLEASSAAAQELVDNKNEINAAVEGLAGIDTSTPGVWTVYDDVVLTEPLTIPEGTTLTIADGGSLTWNMGAINLNGSGSLNSGTISISQSPTITIDEPSLTTGSLNIDNSNTFSLTTETLPVVDIGSLNIGSGDNSVIITGPITVDGTLTINDGTLTISDPNFNPISNNNPGAGITMTGTTPTSTLTITGGGSIIGELGTLQLGPIQTIPQPDNNSGVGATFTSISTSTPINNGQSESHRRFVHDRFEKGREHLKDGNRSHH